MVKTYIEKLIKEKEARDGPYHPDDWCYLYNFSDSDRPQMVNLPASMARRRGESIDTIISATRRMWTAAATMRATLCPGLQDIAYKAQQSRLWECRSPCALSTPSPVFRAASVFPYLEPMVLSG